VNLLSRPQTVKLVAGEPHGPLLELEPLVPLLLEIGRL